MNVTFDMQNCEKTLKNEGNEGEYQIFFVPLRVVLYANGIFVFRYDKDGDISDGDDMRR